MSDENLSKRRSANDESVSKTGPGQCVGNCPVCGEGLCGIRVCTGDDPTVPVPERGFVLCDECEALWMNPDLKSEHCYLDAESPRCPICQGSLWGNSRWADRMDVETLGWSEKVAADWSDEH